MRGKIFPLGDKSISHRAVILSALSKGKTTISNFPLNKDCLSTLESFHKLGIRSKIISKKYSATLIVDGCGLLGLKKPKGYIFIKESGTTFRLLLGVLAGQGFPVKLVAGKVLSKRPMLRVIKPLRMMGAKINRQQPPIEIKGGNLRPITYKMPVASAQVKSAILLAGLFSKGKTAVIEPIATRDHTERMFKEFGADLKVNGNRIVIKGGRNLVSPKKIYLPGDISSAAFFIVLGTIVPDSRILIKNVSLNPTRTGVLRVLKRMGANIQSSGLRAKSLGLEPMGDLIVKSSALKGTVVKKEEIPSLIDELPILMVAASLAKGSTVFESAEELRVKETDRIRSMTENLKRMGADIKVVKTGKREDIVIHGVPQLLGARVKSFGDHRTAMSMLIAGAAAAGKTKIDDISCISKSAPDFISTLRSLVG